MYHKLYFAEGDGYGSGGGGGIPSEGKIGTGVGCGSCSPQDEIDGDCTCVDCTRGGQLCLPNNTIGTGPYQALGKIGAGVDCGSCSQQDEVDGDCTCVDCTRGGQMCLPNRITRGGYGALGRVDGGVSRNLSIEKQYWAQHKSQFKKDPTTQKEIISFIVHRKRESINQKGEGRRITVRGTPDSIFSLTIQDSSGCSILQDEISNVALPSNGVWEFTQKFPSIHTDLTASKTKEVYDITITPAADVILNERIDPTIPTVRLYQYADPTINLSIVSEKTSPAMIVSKTSSGRGFVSWNESHSVEESSDIAAGSAPGTVFKITDPTVPPGFLPPTGGADTNTSAIQGYSCSQYGITIGEDPSTNGKWYVKNAGFSGAITSDTLIKKVVNRCGETGLVRELVLDPLTTRTESTIESDAVITGDLQVGMSLYSKVEHTKTVVASLNSDGEVLDFEKCESRFTDKFKLSDTNDLYAGMGVVIDGRFLSSIVSVDCDTTITISSKQNIRRYTSVVFKKEIWSSISSIRTLDNGKGQTVVDLSSAVDIPDNTTVEFDDDSNVIDGFIQYSGSGSDTILLTLNVCVVKFGKKNVTHILDLDKFITRAPNTRDVFVSTKKNTAVTINMINGDFDDNASGKTGTVVRSPERGTVGSYVTGTDSFVYTPIPEFTGEDSFTFTMSDGYNSSDEKTAIITVK